MKKWHFKSSLSHSWIEWSRDGSNFLENVLFFWPLTTQFYGKIVPKNQHLTRVSTFCLQINAPNGTFSQPESTAGACCDARNCFDAHTEWIKEVIACDVLPVAMFVVCETRINSLDIYQCNAVIHCLFYIINCFILVSLLNCFVFIIIIATQLDHAVM